MDLARRDGIIVAIGEQLRQHQALLHANAQLQRILEHPGIDVQVRSEEHTSELQSLRHLVCRLLLEKKKTEE